MPKKKKTIEELQAENEELIAKNGFFAELVDRQRLDRNDQDGQTGAADAGGTCGSVAGAPLPGDNDMNTITEQNG
ncbi:MAG: hypothetical protein IKG46_07045 [Solobacterium sp.]|nr:hypothetical protein [Solobacterium sp.]